MLDHIVLKVVGKENSTQVLTVSLQAQYSTAYQSANDDINETHSM